MKDINYYEAADRAIQAMNRDTVREFGRLKTAKFDELNIIQQVNTLYRRQTRKAKQRYFEVGFEGYILGLYLCGFDNRKAHRMAEKAITPKWVDEFLRAADPVTLYAFYPEAERKAARLAESLSVTNEPIAEIEKAMRYWSKQTGQYAIDVTDEAVKQSYRDAGIDEVMWVTARDERVCEECGPMDGQVFPIDRIPPKPHWGCRCMLYPVRKT